MRIQKLSTKPSFKNINYYFSINSGRPTISLSEKSSSNSVLLGKTVICCSALHTSTFSHVLGAFCSNSIEFVWTGLARQLALQILVSSRWTEFTRCTGEIVPRTQAAGDCKTPNDEHYAAGIQNSFSINPCTELLSLCTRVALGFFLPPSAIQGLNSREFGLFTTT